ncbi:TetR/AcrR family transcriptional regulator [Lactiplantibacillus garii]|uniref:TetR/AcrR family transcriptional regulator n=1 Tax=Lactiplantibacillus garii TaxID=2306423 RepID=A0A426D533_9LACO|nr:TetR/AcrR family transcriptional regulator [Lactiplantibacillus garii]RRK09674.1 TetR/AcrR family transcriptional regulator [Lactiplantibacillus garii]
MTTVAERKHHMIMTITETIVQNGFATLKMDQIAKLMGVSRGKLYQYYSSKDAVIAAVVAEYRQFMTEQPVPPVKNAADSVQHFPRVLLSLITLIGSSSWQFRTDLAHDDPELSQQFEHDYAEWLARTRQFFAAGIANGAYNDQLNPDLLIMQLEAMIPVAMKPAALSRYGGRTQDVLPDYLQMLMTQVVVPSKWAEVDFSTITAALQHLTLKYQRVLTK